jgi:hypothetical protein
VALADLEGLYELAPRLKAAVANYAGHTNGVAVGK